MKNILKLNLVAALLFVGINTYAIGGNDDFALYVIKGNGKEVTFGLNNVTKANLSIYDQDGNLIYSEKATGKNGILKTFSFEEFPEGTYFLEVEDGVKTIKHEITIRDNATVLSAKAVSTVYKEKSSDKNTSVAIR
ncbi:T9SS type A sorting domain-containing protein [Flavobacterium gyeonganense]|uniref:T9SS type A sorting domain-containing protein n=1 Tax=Flavobacterium gyeonganense TaxID=1310418 RepID=A0ABV5HD68_9FLAO|nr:T9SS type A sorting domain-containing protein [Flavobacterium gyeonganense]